MEILSDATFKGSATFNKNVTIEHGILNISDMGCGTGIANIPLVNATEINLSDVYGRGRITLNDQSISNWSCLNNILNFAPSSTVESLCTTVAFIPRFCSITLPSDVPADCTRFTICAHGNHPVESAYYMFMTKGTNPMSLVNIDLEARCDSTTYNNWSFVATKSSGFEMKSSDGYVLKFFYNGCNRDHGC